MPERVITNLLKDVKIPRMVRIHQKFPRPKIDVNDIPNVILSQFSEEKFSSKIRPGMSICITCGSRGISNIPLIISSDAYNFKPYRQVFVVVANGHRLFLQVKPKHFHLFYLVISSRISRERKLWRMKVVLAFSTWCSNSAWTSGFSTKVQRLPTGE